MKKLRTGIFGISGAVGKEILNVIEERKFPVGELRCFASERSAGKIVDTFLGKIEIENADHADFSELDIAFFAISGGWSEKNARKAAAAGCAVVDNSSAFRYDPEVPLVIPEINPETIGSSKLIANPNCTTAIAAVPLWVVHKLYGLKKVIISTYQATSGAGAAGMNELKTSTKEYLNGSPADKIKSGTFQHSIAFNLIPHIDVFQKNLYTKEEMKVVWETRKIFGDESLNISCTCVRIPTMRAHSESIVVETERPVDPDKVREVLRTTDGVEVKDNPEENIYPMPLTASGKYDVEVGRIRKNLIFGDHGLEFFISGDQLLKGAALNAVEIAETMNNQGKLG